ncbi:hypothetical protein E7811_15415 [Aliigemmobacter aestuarii]|uniref:Uncharacterized protein n=1 Tax=Aliigemmobacter aestuarii TaxID=1445661 RepID=A0A4S3MLH0_9RHOB|nr:hypothetical protein [Gemmobacter aestuarii]THD82430.1 hypothetical protein E7811_15415 [Gemmobacter aestuarii]
MLDLIAFKSRTDAQGSCALSLRRAAKMQPVTGFGAPADTEDKMRSPAEIIKAFKTQRGRNV